MRQAGSEDLDCGRQRGRQLIPIWAGEISLFCLAQTRTNGLKCFSIFGQSHLAVGRGTALPAWAADTDKAFSLLRALLICCYLSFIKWSRCRGSSDTTNKATVRPARASPGPALPLLTRVPNLRQGPPNREGVCSWLMEGPLGCLWPGIRSDSAGRFCLWFLCCLHCCVVGSLETIPQSAVPSSPELLGRNGLEWPRDKKAVLVPSQSFRSWKRILGL